MKRVWVFVVLVVMMSGLVVVSGPSEASGNAGIKAPTLTPHDPIHIDGHGDFTFENGVSSGSGTETNPYIIENRNINASSADGIGISNTDVYFIIKNCVIHDGKNNDGIYFHNVINGKIENCEIYNNNCGIVLYNSTNNNLTANNVHNNDAFGIYLDSHSNNNLLSANRVYNSSWHGIEICVSSNNNLNANHAHNNSCYGMEKSATGSSLASIDSCCYCHRIYSRRKEKGRVSK